MDKEITFPQSKWPYPLKRSQSFIWANDQKIYCILLELAQRFFKRKLFKITNAYSYFAIICPLKAPWPIIFYRSNILSTKMLNAMFCWNRQLDIKKKTEMWRVNRDTDIQTQERCSEIKITYLTFQINWDKKKAWQNKWITFYLKLISWIKYKNIIYL